MPFKLQIEFAGLCMFAARSDDHPRMYVLMPSVRGNHHGVGLHIPVLKFDTNHLQPGQTGGSGLFAQKLLRNREFVIPGSGAAQPICSQIADVGQATGKQVLPNLLGPSPSGLAARVTLLGGAMTAVARGACWEWQAGEYRTLSHRALWEVPAMEGDALPIELLSLATSQPEHLTLYPVTAGSELVLRINVHHMTAEDLVPEQTSTGRRPDVGDYGWHFAPYYDLFGPQTPLRLPRFRPDADCLSATGTCAEWLESGGLAYNCMLAGGG
ncbi:MAG: hypothetical protein KY467_02760 [Gemmatimonadetes bacterium]|nr:hypothetical protein [Gemmatimonadota bacterium]